MQDWKSQSHLRAVPLVLRDHVLENLALCRQFLVCTRTTTWPHLAGGYAITTLVMARKCTSTSLWPKFEVSMRS